MRGELPPKLIKGTGVLNMSIYYIIKIIEGGDCNTIRPPYRM